LDSGDPVLVDARAALHTDAQVALQTDARVVLQTDVLVTSQTVVQDTPLSRQSLERDYSDQIRENSCVLSRLFDSCTTRPAGSKQSTHPTAVTSGCENASVTATKITPASRKRGNSRFRTSD
jgi:hypothetical protein